MSSHLPHPYQNPEYAPPVLRAPSPTSSVGTTYGPDQTSFSDTEQQLSQPAFENKWLAKLDLDKPRKEEEDANQSPLLSKPRSREEETGEYILSFFDLIFVGTVDLVHVAMVEKIIKNLRAEIRKLEEDELFEQTILRGSQVGLETRPSTNDIDALMKSMRLDMSSTEGPTGKIFGHMMDETLLDGPWNIPVQLHEAIAMESAMTTTSTVGKRSRSGKTRKVG